MFLLVDELSNAVTSGLVLGFLVGVMQLGVFTIFARPILAATGIPDSSSMHRSAISYMRARALSAPPATLWLVATGAFRGMLTLVGGVS
jgi:Na+-driven multidrug efflux pump